MKRSETRVDGGDFVGKKVLSIRLPCEMRDQLEMIRNEDGAEAALEAIICAMRYAETGKDNSQHLHLAGRMIYNQLVKAFDSDVKSYVAACERNRDNIRKRWERNDTTVYDRIQSNTNEYETYPLHDITRHNTEITKKERQEEKSKRFVPPTVEEVERFCTENNIDINAQEFVDYYTSNGWKVGKNPMRDWKASVRTWARRQRTTHAQPDSQPPRQTLRPGAFDL